VRYAALDAIAGREIYLELRRQGQLPPDGLLEALMSEWLLSGDEGDWRWARSLAMERDSLRRLFQLGTGQSCFQRFPPILKEGGNGSTPLVAAPVTIVRAADDEEEEEEEEEE
jgi:hypothetical protein